MDDLALAGRFVQGHHDLHGVARGAARVAVFGDLAGQPGEQFAHLVAVGVAADGADIVGFHTQLHVLPALAVEQAHLSLVDFEHALAAADLKGAAAHGLLPVEVGLDEQLGTAGKVDQTHAAVFDGHGALVAVGIAHHRAGNPLGLRVAEDEANAVDGVGAAVEQAVDGVGGDEQGLADGALPHPFARFLPARGEATLVADYQFSVAGVAGGDHAIGGAQADGHGFFADHRFDSGLRRGDGEFVVQQVPGADADDVGLHLGERFLDGGVALGDVEFFHVLLAGEVEGVDDGDYLDVVQAVSLDVAAADGTAADDDGCVFAGHVLLLGKKGWRYATEQ